MNLKQAREIYEEGLMPVCVLDIGGYPSTVLVVLEPENGMHHSFICYRYQTVGYENERCEEYRWDVEVDHEHADLIAVFEWFEKWCKVGGNLK